MSELSYHGATSRSLNCDDSTVLWDSRVTVTTRTHHHRVVFHYSVTGVEYLTSAPGDYSLQLNGFLGKATTIFQSIITNFHLARTFNLTHGPLHILPKHFSKHPAVNILAKIIQSTLDIIFLIVFSPSIVSDIKGQFMYWKFVLKYFKCNICFTIPKLFSTARKCIVFYNFKYHYCSICHTSKIPILGQSKKNWCNNVLLKKNAWVVFIVKNIYIQCHLIRKK